MAKNVFSPKSSVSASDNCFSMASSEWRLKLLGMSQSAVIATKNILTHVGVEADVWGESQGPFDLEPPIENAAPARTTASLSTLKPKMNPLDKKITQMQDELALLHRQREAARLERAKSYADAFIRKLEADDIPLAVGLQAFQDLSKFSGMKSTSNP
jgi:hypothetical protein